MSKTLESLIKLDKDLITALEHQSKKLIEELNTSASIESEFLIQKNIDNKLSIAKNINLTADEQLLAEISGFEEEANKLSSFIDQLRNEGYSGEDLEYARDVENNLKAVAIYLKAIYVLKSVIKSNDSLTIWTNGIEGFNLYIVLVEKYWKNLGDEVQNVLKKIAFYILDSKLEDQKFIEVLKARINSKSEDSFDFFQRFQNLVSKVWEISREKFLGKEITDKELILLIEWLETKLTFAELVLAATKKYKVQRPSAEDAKKAISTMNSWSDRFDEDEMYETLIFLEQESENDNSP